jgi:hypothetical protein
VNLAAAVAERVAAKAAQPPACDDVTVMAAWAVGTVCAWCFARSGCLAGV